MGHGIKCFRCKSDKGWDDCVNKNDTTCSSKDGQCVKSHLVLEKNGNTQTTYIKECVTKAICDDGCKVFERQGFNVKTCDYSCCDSDLCNGAKVPMASGFLFLTCAFVLFFR